ncbi:MAG: alpha/beta fold hydrolase [Acidimicrobiales bacterium]
MALPALRFLRHSDPDETHLTWHRTEVQGRTAVYGVGGVDGPAVVFLHGWALGSHAYKRAINRLTARGCHVYAPAMPSFGGTADLPEPGIDAFAHWVADFMAAMDIDEPVMVIGHSFGGGVSVKLADLYPERVSYLVLLNAVGGVSARPLWEWAAAFGRELWPPHEVFEMGQAVRADLLPNLLRNPLGMARVARVAQDADLRVELARVRKRGTPVLVLTSEADSVIPRDAFAALCEAVGADGQVVHGGHSWLLAHPDSFDEVMGAVVGVQLSEHRAWHAPGRMAEVAALLEGSRMSQRTARALVRKAPPLWLMSEAPAVLAADLALWQPKLGPDEVRAMSRPMEGTRRVRLTIATADRAGLLADCAAVLAAEKVSIVGGSAAAWERPHRALISLVLPDTLDEKGLTRLGEQLRAVGRGEDAGGAASLERQAIGPLHVEIHGQPQAAGRSLVEVRARDRLGLLATLCRRITDGGAVVESMHARTVKGVAHDTFLVSGTVDAAALGDRPAR